MKKLLLPVICVLLTLSFCINAHADFFASTDRVSYTGTMTKYNSLGDAQGGINSVASYSIPARDTATPYNTGYRDAAIFFSNNAPNYYSNNSTFMTSWYYTTSDNTNGKLKNDPAGDRYYSGYGNPNNTNTGFVQIADGNGSTTSAANGYFSNYSGGYYRNFTLQVSGGNADYANSWARLWHGGIGGAAGLTAGKFISYNLNMTFGGLMGSLLSNGWIEANNHPDSVSGTFRAIFQNTNTVDPSFQGFYAVNYTFGLDNWAYGQSLAGTLNGDISPSQFAAPVPIPGALWLLGSGLVGIISLRRRMK